MNNFLQSFFKKKLGTKEYIAIFKRLSFLLRGSVTLSEALRVLESQVKENKGRDAEKEFFKSVCVSVFSGKTLSGSIASLHTTLPSFVVSVISLGEESGTLGDSLNYIAIELEKRRQLFRKILGALAYPSVVGLATLGVSGLLTMYIFPKIQPIFLTLHTTLPFSTKLLVFVSSTLRSYGIIIFLFIGLCILSVIFLYKKSEKYHTLFEKTILMLPFFGSLTQQYSLANASRMLGLLFTNGTSAPEALQIVSKASSNSLYAKEFILSAETLSSGISLSDVLSKNSSLFPKSFTHMVSVGESGGTLGETFIYLAHFYEQELDEKTKTITGALEPLLMVGMGLIVGFVAVSIITPIYQITQNLHG